MALKITTWFGGNTTGFDAAANKVRRGVADLKTHFGGLGRSLGVGLSVAGLAAFGKKVLKTGSDFQHFADRAGIGSEAFQAFAAAAEDSGASVEQVGVFLNKLRGQQDKAINGDKAAQESLTSLGLTMDQVSKMTGEQFVDAVAKGYAETKNFGALIKLTGEENAPKMEAALLAVAENGFPAFIDNAKEAGQVMDEEFTAAAENMETQLGKLERRLTVFASKVLTKFNDGSKLIGAVFDEYVKGDKGAMARAQAELDAEKEADKAKREEKRRKGAEGRSERAETAEVTAKKIKEQFSSLRAMGAVALGNGRDINRIPEKQLDEQKKATEVLAKIERNTSGTGRFT